ncbi:heme peroxidase [Mycena olivaceomarginata]|nr:heme peroxidase [Mycena olivaceomarginata]
MLGLVLLVQLVTAHAYTWPSPKLDALESLRFDLDKHAFAGFIRPCDLFIFSGANSGRSDAADWIRNAYHDMATHNIVDGTGGMDGSIRFSEEQSRPEASGAWFLALAVLTSSPFQNAGDGFSNTVGLLFLEVNRYISVADAFAVGAIQAIENCGGPEIAFRGGRVDATGPNSPGVPEPQQDLDEHIASFARQGFTQSEMIGLVACGHSFGGVQHDPFPDIVPELNDPNNTQSVQHFDSTNVHFDNNIATEYISSTTQNPLVVGFNDTTNSDKRIFGSDGNATMLSFANSPDLFASTCATLFAKMLDTIPSGVQLTDVIRALPVKPDNVQLVLDGDTLRLSGQLRLWNTTGDVNRTVRVIWDDRVGGTHNATLAAAQVDTNSPRTPAAWYSFPVLSLDAVAGIEIMRFTVNGKLEDQDGVGFAVDDRVVFANTSCRTSSSSNPLTARYDVGVRSGVNVTRVYLEEDTLDDIPLPIVIETDFPPPTQPTTPTSAYSIWSTEVSVDVTSRPFDVIQFSIGAEIDGVKITDNGQHVLTALPLCPGAT